MNINWHIKFMQLPEFLKNVDKSALNFVDDWAFAGIEEIGLNFSTVYFLSKTEFSHLIKFGVNEIRAASHIHTILPSEYASKNKAVFEKGIKATILQLVHDGFYEKALNLTPTQICAFDRPFMNEFHFALKESFQESNTSVESQKHFFGVKYRSAKNQQELNTKYIQLKKHIKKEPQL